MPSSSRGSARHRPSSPGSPSRGVTPRGPVSSGPTSSGGGPGGSGGSDAGWALQAFEAGALGDVLAQSDAGTGERVVVSLQRAGGNGATGRLVVSALNGAKGGTPVAQRSGPVVQRAVPTADEVQKAIDEGDVGAIKSWDSFGPANTTQLRQMIDIVSKQGLGWVPRRARPAASVGSLCGRPHHPQTRTTCCCSPSASRWACRSTRSRPLLGYA